MSWTRSAYNQLEPIIILSIYPRERFKQTSLKGCHESQNVTVLSFLEPLQFKLWNLFHRPCHGELEDIKLTIYYWPFYYGFAFGVPMISRKEYKVIKLSKFSNYIYFSKFSKFNFLINLLLQNHIRF